MTTQTEYGRPEVGCYVDESAGSADDCNTTKASRSSVAHALKSIPFGRIAELQALPDAELIALQSPQGLFSEYMIKRYASRKALEVFLRNPGSWFALVKTPVPAGMLIYPAFQKEI